jgi:hypothetical protein
MLKDGAPPLSWRTISARVPRKVFDYILNHNLSEVIELIQSFQIALPTIKLTLMFRD